MQTPINSDKIKSFYYYFRPIALICKLVGVFPLKNVHHRNPKDIFFRFLSFAHLYSTLVFLAVGGMLNYLAGFIFIDFKLLDSSNNCFIYGRMVTNLMLVRSFLCFGFCIYHSRKLPALIYMLDTFGIKKASNVLFLNSPSKGFIRMIFQWTLFPILLGFGLTLLTFKELFLLFSGTVTDSCLNENEVHYAAVFYGILGLWQLVPLLIYIYLASKIVSEFKELNAILLDNKATEVYKLDEEIRYNENLTQLLSSVRYLHSLLSSAVNQLSYCYGNFMAIDQLCITVMFVVNIYVFIMCSNRDEHVLNITIINGIVILMVLVVSQIIKDEAAKVLDLIRGIQFGKINEYSRIEIQMFMMQLAARPVEISAAGFFTVSKHQIPVIISSVATYLIVLIQFQSGVINPL